jgi:hypothetical protein
VSDFTGIPFTALTTNHSGELLAVNTMDLGQLAFSVLNIINKIVGTQFILLTSKSLLI